MESVSDLRNPSTRKNSSHAWLRTGTASNHEPASLANGSANARYTWNRKESVANHRSRSPASGDSGSSGDPAATDEAGSSVTSRSSASPVAAGPKVWDPGIRLITSLIKRLAIKPDLCEVSSRGLVWWPHRLGQRIDLDPPRKKLDGDVFARLHIRTDLGVGAPDSAAELQPLIASASPLSSVYLDREWGRLCLASSLDVTQANRKRFLELARWVSWIQAADAERLHDILVNRDGCARVLEAGKGSAEGADPPALMAYASIAVGIHGRRAPGWTPTAMAFAALSLGSVTVAEFHDDRLALDLRRARLACSGRLQLEVMDDERWGAGLACRLRLGGHIGHPWVRTLLRAGEATARELEQGRSPALLGHWVDHEGGLEFRAFYPDCLSRLGIRWIVADLVERARLADEWIEESKLRGSDPCIGPAPVETAETATPKQAEVSIAAASGDLSHSLPEAISAPTGADGYGWMRSAEPFRQSVRPRWHREVPGDPGPRFIEEMAQ